MEFQVWDAAVPGERQAWASRWNEWHGREVFAHPDYVRLYANGHTRALCAAADADGTYVLYPFLLRELGEEPYCERSLRDSTDLVTPYGYGGPFTWGKPSSKEDIEGFWREFGHWAERSRAVSEFLRLSLFPHSLLEYPGTVRTCHRNVLRSLKSMEQLWREFEPKVRKNVNRARSSGVTVKIDETGEYLDQFLTIYAGTMDRRHAQKAYYFPREYFERMQAGLRGQFAYFHAFAGGRIISTELVLVSAERVYSFLGGTDSEWFHLRPNDLVKTEIMNWAWSEGKSEYVLGGGYLPDDGIYRFKLSFAPDGIVPFSVGSRILDPDAYECLTRARARITSAQGSAWQPDPEYFPAYRS